MQTNGLLFIPEQRETHVSCCHPCWEAQEFEQIMFPTLQWMMLPPQPQLLRVLGLRARLSQERGVKGDWLRRPSACWEGTKCPLMCDWSPESEISYPVLDPWSHSVGGFCRVDPLWGSTSCEEWSAQLHPPCSSSSVSSVNKTFLDCLHFSTNWFPFGQ